MTDIDQRPGGEEALDDFYARVPAAHEYDARWMSEGQILGMLEHRLGARIIERRRHER